MTSVGNEPVVNGEGSSHRQETSSHRAPTHGLHSLDFDLLSDPSRLISLVLSGTDSHDLSSRRRRERQRAYAPFSQEELSNMLIDKEHEASRLMKALRTALQRMDSQGTRISELERDSQEALDRLRQINESRIQVQRQATRAEQELQLYRTELEHARRELVRGQDMVRILQQQRDEAEQAAARARAKARKLRQQRLVDAAKEEGRKWGFHDGYVRAKQVLTVGGTIDELLPTIGPTDFAANSNTQSAEADDDAASVRSSASEFIQQTEIRPPSVHSTHSESTAIRNRTDDFNDMQQSSSAPQLQQGRSESRTEGAPPVTMPPTDEPVMLQPDAQFGTTHTNTKSPAISVFQVDFADYNTNYGNAFNKVPKKTWVTATQHNQMNTPDPLPRSSSSRNRPPPDHPGTSHATKVQPIPQDEKKKKSWYRTFSLRRLGKRREIDPDPIEEKPPGPSNVRPLDGNVDEDEMYHYQRPPSMSWYQPKGSSLHASSKFRPSSAGSASSSTNMSQLPLVNTPAALFTQDMNVSNPSLSGRSNKESGIVKKIKEKESLLSIIREDPLSREATPLAERNFGGNRFKIPGIPHAASSSTMNSQDMGGPLHSIAAALSDSRNPQYIPMAERSVPYGKHKRSASEATPPVTIQVQTPSQSQSRTSSDFQRVRDELPNRFLSPSLASQRLPHIPRVQRHRTQDDQSSSRGVEAHKPSHQTSAMNIKEKYLAKTAAEETGSHGKSPSSSSRVRELPDNGRPMSRQSAHVAESSRPAPVPAAPYSPIYQASPDDMNRQFSTASLRTIGSYSKFNPSTYVDPAFFEPNAAPRDVPTRPASSASHLSYVTDKR